MTKEGISILIVIIIGFALVVLASVSEAKADEKAWNNGYCAECGCPWRYQDMYHHGEDFYIYTDKENHVIKVRKNYGLGVDK